MQAPNPGEILLGKYRVEAIIGVGGIDSPATALAMRAAGANLVQLYTGLVYQGPGLVRSCVRALADAGRQVAGHRGTGRSDERD